MFFLPQIKALDKKDHQIKTLTELVQKLTSRIGELENKLAKYSVPKNSTNSSVPPSKDENRPTKTRSLRSKSGKKSGGQPGHKGHRLEMSTTPDQFITHVPDFCSSCGQSLSELHADHQLSRQIVDIPIPKAIYTEHQSYAKTCSCGHITHAQIPKYIKAPIQYGQNIEALVGYLHARQYVPYQRLSEILSTCFGISLSEGSIDNIISRLAKKAHTIYERIHHEIATARVVGSDETGVKINGRKNWIWTWQNQDYTYITVSPSRGYQVIEDEYPEGFLTLFCAMMHGELILNVKQRDINYVWPTYSENCITSKKGTLFFIGPTNANKYFLRVLNSKEYLDLKIFSNLLHKEPS